jgi:hypothetical protein
MKYEWIASGLAKRKCGNHDILPRSALKMRLPTLACRSECARAFTVQPILMLYVFADAFSKSFSFCESVSSQLVE